MMSNQDELQGAIQDLGAIRRAIESAEAASWGGRLIGTTSLHLVLHICLAAIVSYLVIAETLIQPSITQRYLLAFQTQEVGIIAVVQIAIVLLLLIGLLYFIVWYQSRRAQESFEDYSARHFTYLRNLSFLSDLFVKFSAISLVIIAMRPDWVAPLLFVFTGDYLIQGRFFVFPVRTSLFLGTLCVLAGTIQCIFLPGTLVYPLISFLIITLLSAGQIIRLRQRDESESSSTD